MDKTPNAFIGRADAPTDADVAAALGAAKPRWNLLARDMARDLGLDGREWKSYSPKAGWSLRLMRKKRNILYLSPCQGSFRVSLILGDKAMAAARAGRLGARATKLLDEAPRYPEGTGLYLEITSARDLPLVKKLVRIKMDH